MRIVIVLLGLFAAAPLAAQPAERPAARREPAVVTEARAFMAAYADALRAGDRAGIAGRYDRNGAFFLGNGRKRFETHAQITASYAGSGWQPPHRFEWHSLSYEPVGYDAVVIAGQFAWTVREGAAPLVFSYTGLAPPAGRRAPDQAGG